MYESNDLKSGQGRVVTVGQEKIAVYKDAQGNLKSYSAVCTHEQCIVNFNAQDKTWDCPCHGSRFNLDGKVINGPAEKDLAPSSSELICDNQ